MKKLLLLVLCSSLMNFIPQSFAETMSSNTPINVIIDVLNGLAGYGAIGTDVSKEKITYYNDKIYLSKVEGTLVQKEAEDWARAEVSKLIEKKLAALKERGYLTSEKYDYYVKEYHNLTYSELSLKLPALYKDYLRFENEIILLGVPLLQDTIYEKILSELRILLQEKRITQEKHDAWKVTTYTQIYEYKSDPNIVYGNFETEAATYKIPLVTSNSNTGNIYYSEIKLQNTAKYTKLSVKNLEQTLLRTKKLEKKYKIGTKDQLKTRALIQLLEETISYKKNMPILKK